MEQQIVFNGKTYARVEDMPVKDRQAYEAIMKAFEDKDQNGLADILETSTRVTVKTNSQPIIVHDGQIYRNLEDMPPQLRAQYEQSMREMDKNQNGIPDFVEGMFGMQAPATEAASQNLVSSEPSFSLPVASPTSAGQTIEPERFNWRLLIFSAALLAFLCMGAVAFVFLSR